MCVGGWGRGANWPQSASEKSNWAEHPTRAAAALQQRFDTAAAIRHRILGQHNEMSSGDEQQKLLDRTTVVLGSSHACTFFDWSFSLTAVQAIQASLSNGNPALAVRFITAAETVSAIANVITGAPRDSHNCIHMRLSISSDLRLFQRPSLAICWTLTDGSQ